MRIHWYSESVTVSNYNNSVSAMVITSDGYREDTKLKLEKNIYLDLFTLIPYM